VLVKRRVPPGIGESSGKRAAKDELAQKKRRAADVAPCKPIDISLGGDRTARTQSAAIFEWSDDDRAPIAPPPSTKASSRNTRAEVPSKGEEEVPEQQAEKMPTAGAARPLAQDMLVDPRAVPRCSRRQCWFITVYQEANV